MIKLKKLGFVVLHHSGVLKLSIPTPKYLKMVFISNGIFGRVVLPAERFYRQGLVWRYFVLASPTALVETFKISCRTVFTLRKSQIFFPFKTNLKD